MDLALQMRGFVPAIVVVLGFVVVSQCIIVAARIPQSRMAEAEAEVQRMRAREQLHLDIEERLRNINKPSAKTIQSPDGDIIDCVRMPQQPAFDHPLLRNHTLQVSPASLPDTLFSLSKASSTSRSSSIIQAWHRNGKCPEGTIPIRRTNKYDLLREGSAQSFGRKKASSTSSRQSTFDVTDLPGNAGHQHAITYVEGDKYYGAQATINVWQPQIPRSNEFSLSQIWILAGSFNGDLNSIEAGWQVSPELYGDNNTRLFIYWTSDAYETTGCYNLLSSGFIQTSSEIAIGGTISPVSDYGGPQYDISITLWKDPTLGHWWMQFGDAHVLGYWPASLFSYLTDSATMIQWGGEVVNSDRDGKHTSTEMGSGHFPDEGFGKASYFRNIQVVDGSNSLKNPKSLSIFTEKSDCYNVQKGSNAAWGSFFFYGGPGDNEHCP